MRFLTFIAVPVLALAAIAPASVASATRAHTTKLVITVKSVTTASIPRDAAPAGASKGDRVLLRDRLVNVAKQFGKPAGAVVGHDEGIVVYTSKTTATFTGVAVLPGGTIRIRGPFTFTSSGSSAATLAVSGGTGRYAHARGVLVIGSGKAPLNTYHLTLGTMTSVSPVV